MNENITAVNRRRQGRKRAIGVAFGALVGTALTILAPGLTSSASAAEVEATGGPGYAIFGNGVGPSGAPDHTMLMAQLGATTSGVAARFGTGHALVGTADSSSQTERVTLTYSLQESPMGATSWKQIDSRTRVTSITGAETAVFLPVTFSKWRYGGTVARYRLVATFDWAEAGTGRHLSTKQLTTMNDWDYRCIGTRLVSAGSISCAVGAVDNRFGINLS